MKLKTSKKPFYKTSQLQILKYFYSRSSSLKYRTDIIKTRILINKISNIIFQYHIKNKKILFLGFPDNYYKTLRNTKHFVIPKHRWLNGILSNNNFFFNNKKKNRSIPLNIFTTMLKLKKKPDLIVICNLNDKFTAIKESYSLRIPTIIINKKSDVLDIKPTYKCIGNYNLNIEKTKSNNLIYSVIKSVIKQAKKVKISDKLPSRTTL